MPAELSEQTRGWLRFIWQKSTTADDWSDTGQPHEWWDQTSTGPMCAFPRFDLGETAYILPVAADVTPAWREVYTRIADELVGRHTTFWAAIDWLTMIGHDPDQGNYPPEWQNFMPNRLRGKYDMPGWVANGVAPWGLQPDPVGSDGNLFFRGFFNLLLGVYRSVSGDDKWEQPFAVTGYQNRRFDWTHSDIARFLHDQWKERPQGPHCENTKIWPFCLSAAGLGLLLYDRLRDTHHNEVYQEWVEYAKKHYLVTNKEGDMKMFSFCYDPIEDELLSFPDPFVAIAAVAVTLYVLPQAPEFGTYLYEQAVTKLGWNDPTQPVFDQMPDPRFLMVGLVVSRELGDWVTHERLAQSLYARADGRWFGPENSQFGYWFGLDEPWPRGQLSALLMVAETGEPGSWCQAFRAPNREKFSQPTVEGIDYPAVDVRHAANDADGQYLRVGISAGLPSQAGKPTRFRVSQLPDANAVKLRCDNAEFESWRALDAHSIEIQADINHHDFVIATGLSAESRTEHEEYRAEPAVAAASAAPAEASRIYVPQASGGSCSCC